MKLEITNPNYCATVVKVHNLLPLENCDNVVGFPIFGSQAIVGKDTKIGDIGILFSTETQLSKKFCSTNNLYRKNDLNSDQSKKGYLEENRRVKAIKFRGHQSNTLFMPLSSLSYLNVKLSEGDSFNNIDGEEVCTKYTIKTYVREPKNKVRGKNQVFERVEAKLFPQHFDVEQYFRNVGRYKPDDFIVLTQKLHGTSGRFGNILVKRKFSFQVNILK